MSASEHNANNKESSPIIRGSVTPEDAPQSPSPSNMIATIAPLRHTPRPVSTNPTAQQWNAQKDHIYHLYRVQDLTHRELAQRMSQTFGCRITEKMVKDRTTKWGFGKTVKAGEYEAILRSRTLDRPHPNLRHTGVWIRGKEVKRRDVERYIKRRKTGPQESNSPSEETTRSLPSLSPPHSAVAFTLPPLAPPHGISPSSSQPEARFDPVRDAGQTHYQQQAAHMSMPRARYEPQQQPQPHTQVVQTQLQSHAQPESQLHLPSPVQDATHDSLSGERYRGYKRPAQSLSSSPEVEFVR